MSESSAVPHPHKHSTLSVDQLLVDERTVVVSLEGELDLWSSPNLKTTLHNQLADGRDRLVLDLTGVGFMDSTALGVLIGFQRRFASEERMAIAGPQAPVLRVLELTGLATGLRIFATRDAALNYVTETDPQPPEGGSVPLTSDAALMLGIASTAMPFAQSAEDQAERWLRALRNHGESGAILASLGLSEKAITEPEHEAGDHPPGRGDPDAVAAVTREANRIARDRGGPKVGTRDVLLGVVQVYGPTFYRVLAAHGVDPAELKAHLAAAQPAGAES